MYRRPGCLAGLLEFGLTGWIYELMQRVFGFRSRSCCGCGCGFIILIVFIIVIFTILFGTDWTRLSLGPLMSLI